MKTQSELEKHLNADIMCESREAQREGIDDDKWRLIGGTYGITWEGIYEIIWPGAPVPSPCKLHRSRDCF